jgi:glycerophosphoryl diester phosphodiesterase
VPSLFEALEILSGRAGVDLEIKNIPGQPGFEAEREQAVEAVVRDLERSAFAGTVLVSSFNSRSIERCRILAPELPTGLLCTEPLPAGDALRIARDAGHGWVLPSVSSLLAAGRELVVEAHLRSILVGTWTVDHPETIAHLLAWGVDAIAANDPAEAVRIRDAWRLSKGS